MRSAPSMMIVSVLVALSSSHLGCASAEDPADAREPAGTSPATEATADSSDTPSREAPAAPAASASPQAPASQDVAPTSTSYPAPHPSMPQIPRYGGSVLHDPLIVSVTFRGDPWAEKLKAFGEQVGSLDWWSTVHAGYGVGAAASAGYVAANEVPASVISDSEVSRWVANKIGDGTLPAPTDQTIYMLYYPQATTVTLNDGNGSAASCQVFLGYHSTFNLTYHGQVIPIAYAVVNRCNTDMDQLTVTASHELTEASTDPHPIDSTTCGFVTLDDNAWTGLGGENGDMCAGVSPVSEGGWALTRVWNNVTAAAGDQPCLPAPDAGMPYFNTGVVNEQLVVPAGGSASTEVDCYSFGPLSAPISLDARFEGRAPVTISFDRKTCTNGDKVTLTATASARAQRGADYRYTLLPSVGSRSAHLWRALVHVQ